MSRAAILIRLDVCEHDKCDVCGGMLRVPHENVVTVTLGEFTDDVQDGWCEGGPDDFKCKWHDEEQGQ